jgi:hypothetical protein
MISQLNVTNLLIGSEVDKGGQTHREEDDLVDYFFLYEGK